MISFFSGVAKVAKGMSLHKSITMAIRYLEKNFWAKHYYYYGASVAVYPEPVEGHSCTFCTLLSTVLLALGGRNRKTMNFYFEYNLNLFKTRY